MSCSRACRTLPMYLAGTKPEYTINNGEKIGRAPSRKHLKNGGSRCDTVVLPVSYRCKSRCATEYHFSVTLVLSMRRRCSTGVPPLTGAIEEWYRCTYWGHRRAADPLLGATGALPTLTKPYRSIAVVVPLLGMAVQRQTFLTMLLISSSMFWRCTVSDVIPLRCRTSTDPLKSPKLCSGIAPASQIG